MLAETLTIMVAGITIVEKITNIFRNLQRPGEDSSNKELEQSIENVQQRVAAVESELHKSQADDNKLLGAYCELVKVLQEDKNYSSQIRIVPTDHGTWKILRKRKKTILRDPQGEYFDSPICS